MRTLAFFRRLRPLALATHRAWVSVSRVGPNEMLEDTTCGPPVTVAVNVSVNACDHEACAPTICDRNALALGTLKFV